MHMPVNGTRRLLFLRVGIWLAFAGTALSLVSISQSDPGRTVAPAAQYTPVSSATAPVPAVVPVPLPALDSGARPDLLAGDTDAILAKGTVTTTREYQAGPTTYTRANAIDLLPAWRWRAGLGDLSVVTSARDFFNVVFSVLAAGCFVIASFIWGLLLWAARAGLTTNFVERGAKVIDDTVEALSTLLYNNGPAWILLIVAAVSAAYAVVVRDNLSQGLRRLLTPAIAVAAMIGFTQVITPSAIALRGVTLVDLAAAPIIGGVSKLTGDTSALLLGERDPKNPLPQPSCRTYALFLYDKYAYLAGADSDVTGTTPEEQSKSYGRNAAAQNITVLSLLWQSSMQRMWTQAQFGGVSYVDSAACHRLEKSSKIDSREHQAIMRGAYGALDNGSDAPSVLLFDSSGDRKTDTARDLGYAACYYQGGWKMRAGWAEVSDLGSAGSAASSNWCAAWWGSGDVGEKLQWKTEKALTEEVIEDGKNSTEARQVKLVVTSYWGQNNTDRLLSGILALAVSGVYAVALGSVLLGGLVAQIGLVLLLAWLPYTLILVGIAGLGRKRFADTAGGKILKMTAGFFGAKAATVLVCTLILQATVVTLTLLRGF
jgi:hypothetical protein